MSQRKIVCSALISILGLSLGLTASTVAADKLDFTGSYILTKRIPDDKSATKAVATLFVHQDGSAIEVTRVVNGQKSSNRFPLDGKEGPFVGLSGDQGTCKAEFQSKRLILESLVLMHPTNAPAAQLRTKERWELSSDSKTLKIRYEVDSPQYEQILKNVQVIPPWTDVYTRQ